MQSTKEKTEKFIMNTYGRYPLTISHAKGSYLFTEDNEKYLDLLSGIAVTNLGHCHEELTKVITEQAQKLVHVSNLFYQKQQAELAELLVSTSHAQKVFFANSGAEANEGMIKLARRYTKTVLKKDAYEIISLKNSFHGRTIATLTATGQTGRIQDGFSPLPEGFKYVESENIEALEEAVSEKTCAVLIEMIQGEGGVRPLSEKYVQAIVRICKEKNILLLVDEIQTGLCRTGKFWAFQHYNIMPDIFSSAKALANGLPMGAVLTTDAIATGFEPGTHATTFGGGALVSAVAKKTIEIMLRDKLAEKAENLGEWFKTEVQELQKKYPQTITEIRGKGLMIGIELAQNAPEIFEQLRDKKFVLNLAQNTILRLLPALIISKEELTSFLQALEEIISKNP